MTPIRIFEGSFGGPTIFANPGTFYHLRLLGVHSPEADLLNPIFRFRIHLPCFCSSFVQADPRTKVQAKEEHAEREGRQADKAEGRVGGGRVGGREGVCLGSWRSGVLGLWCFDVWGCGVSYVSSLYIYILRRSPEGESPLHCHALKNVHYTTGLNFRKDVQISDSRLG